MVVEEDYRENNKLLQRIVVNNFTEYVKKVKNVRPVPYVKNKCRLPKKYEDENIFEWRSIRYWGKQIEARFRKDTLGNKDFLISNSKTANKEREVKVNGQDIYNQNGGSFNRSFLKNTLHSYFKDVLKDVPKIDNVEEYPLYIWMRFYIHDMGKSNIDNDNKWPWEKFFNDTLTECGIIDDDNAYIMNDNRKTTILIPKDQPQRLVIDIYGK